jgi:multiple sugar transport system substrate-binding protein
MHRVLKRVAAVATGVLMAAPMAACGSSNAPAAGQATTLKVWVMGTDGTNFQDLTKDFTASTNISVQVEAIPWDSVNEKLTTAVASGNGPDVMQIGLSLLANFESSGALADIGGSIGAYPNLKSSNFLDAVSSDKLNPAGKVLSVPWLSDTRVLFYRTDILAAQGITSPPTTWDQLKADAAKLATRGKDQYGYYIPQWDAPLPIEFTWQAGGDVVDSTGKVSFDTAQFRQAVDFYLSFYADKQVPTASDFDQTQGFISGAAPMLISGPYLAQAIKTQAPDLAGKWGVTTLPADKDGTALFAGSNLGVFSKSTKVDAAVKLLDYLSAPATQLKWYQLNGDLPTVKAALNDPSLANDPTVQVYVRQLANAKLLPITASWDQASQKMLAALNNIALKGADKQATLTQLNQDVASLQK